MAMFDYYEGWAIESEKSYLETTSLVGDDVNIIGRKIKIWANSSEEVAPWWQSKTVSVGDVAFSNGHYYLAEDSGTTGNIQPSHTEGVVSDGKIKWRYIHSGTATATVLSVESSDYLTAKVDSGKYIPVVNNASSATPHSFDNFQWSIIGYKSKYPSNIYMHQNRLGLIINTEGYGAWNCLSCSDDYFNFSTEQLGQQLDTSALINIVPDNEDGRINWVISASQLYMGGHSGEFIIKSPNKILTPTSIEISKVNTVGGSNVIPAKYKELNLFVGSDRDQIHSIGYDYTIDDYTPKNIGLFVDHLLENKITRLEPLNNKDQNIYVLHDSKEVSLLKYSGDQKVLAYSRLKSSGEDVLDFTSSMGGGIRSGYFAVSHGADAITLESLAIEEPTYMFDTVDVEAFVTETNQSVGDAIQTKTPKDTISGGHYTVRENNIQKLFKISGEEIVEVPGFQNDISDINNKLKPVFVDGDYIIAVGNIEGAGYGHGFSISNDAGETWSAFDLNVFYDGTAYDRITAARNGNTIVVSRYYGSAPDSMLSYDGGLNWIANSEIGSVYFESGMWFGVFLIETGGELSEHLVQLRYSFDAKTWLTIGVLDTVNFNSDSLWVINSVKVFDGKIFISFGRKERLGSNVYPASFVVCSTTSISKIYKNDWVAQAVLPTGDAMFIVPNDESWNFKVYKYNKDLAGLFEEIDCTEQVEAAIGRALTERDYLISKDDVVFLVSYNINKEAYRISVEQNKIVTGFVPIAHHANKEVWVKFGEDLSQFKRVTLDAEGNTTEIPDSPRYQVGLPMVCELHTQPAFGNKVEGMQQQSIAVYLRLHKSGAFYYGSSVDFDKYFEYSDWPDRQGFGEGRALYTGDCALNIPLGYAEAANQGDAKYPNSSAVGINIKCDTPEPFNLLAIQEIYK